MTVLRGLCDYHIGENISEIRLDLPRYFAQLQRMGVEVLTLLTKDAMGTSYYDTKAGHRNRHMTFDMVAGAAELARRHDIKLIAYYNASLDDHLDALHPDWRQMDARGESPYVLRQYTAFCMNTPYRDRVRAQLEELAGNYDIDGIWLDITYIFDGRCYCEHCRRLFRERYGRAIPEAPALGSEEMIRLKAFRRECRNDFLSDFTRAVRAIRGPEFSVGWNHAGDMEFCQVEADRQASYFSVEFHAPSYELVFLQTAWMRPFDKPIELMMSECLYGWGEWTVLPEATLKAMGAMALAVGGGLCLGHVPVPSGPQAGALAEPVVDRVAALWEWLQPRQAACEDATSVPGAAIISPAAAQYLDAATQGTWLEGPSSGVTGAHRILLESHQPADLLTEETLGKLGRYEFAVLPGIGYVPPSVCAALKSYVEAGGVLIVDGASGSLSETGEPLADFSIAAITGTHLVASSGLTSRYFDRISPAIACGLPSMPILVRSTEPIQDVTVDADCEVLATFTDPEYERQPRRHVYHQHGHPAVPTDSPAIVRRKLGRGQVVHLVAPLSADYRMHGDPSLRRLFKNIVNTLVPDSFLHVKAPPSVRVTAMRKEHRLLIHLIHWHQDHAQGPSFIEAEIPVPGIHLSVRGARPSGVRQLDDEGCDLPVVYRDGRIEIDVAPLRTHALIVIEW